MPGLIVTVCGPGGGQRQADSAGFGGCTEGLVMFCQIPVRLNVSVPSTNTRACPVTQHTAPIEPMMAIAWPVKLILTSVSSRRRLSSTNYPRRQNPGSAGAPCGSRAAAAWIRAAPPLICQAVATDAAGGPADKRPEG